MAELTVKERCQPCLLDRLTDDDPQARAESRDRRVVSPAAFRRAVLRDIAWLLNTATRLKDEEMADLEQVDSSTLNYGVPDRCGQTGSGIDAHAVERTIAEAIKRFEPRIQPNTLRVKVNIDREHMGVRALQLSIEGQMWSQPMPEHLYMKTELDLQTGTIALEDRGNG